MTILKGEVSEINSYSKIFKKIEIETGEFEEDIFSDKKIAITKECYKLNLVMDFLSFLYGNINEDKKEDLKNKINRLFQRKGINFELKEDGKIIRIVSPFFEKLQLMHFVKDDYILNEHLNNAYENFQSSDFNERKIALKELWDAFERVSSSHASKRIPQLINNVLNADISKSKFISNEANKIEEIYKLLFEDATKEGDKLKKQGNIQNIRHSNELQNPLDNSDYVDYLFYRMSATIHLLLTGLNKEK